MDQPEGQDLLLTGRQRGDQSPGERRPLRLQAGLLRSSIKRLLIKYRYPPDEQPGPIKLVMEQMELLAPRYAQLPQTHREM